MSKITLRKPLLVDNEEKKEIEYNFESVKPIQYINLVKRLSKKQPISVPEVNIDVQLGYFSLASDISVGDLKRLESIQDFNEIISKTRDFLLVASEETEEEMNSSEQ